MWQIVAMAKKIAIVEDEAAIRENYAAAFEREGYRVDAYEARIEALQAFDVRLPDLVVIDINLKDDVEGGFELCRELRSRAAELPIIFLTARDSEFDAVSGLRLGADDYLTKEPCFDASMHCRNRSRQKAGSFVAISRSIPTA
jgi:two-component system OmpR family response regulator